MADNQCSENRKEWLTLERHPGLDMNMVGTKRNENSGYTSSKKGKSNLGYFESRDSHYYHGTWKRSGHKATKARQHKKWGGWYRKLPNEKTLTLSV
jgi:hypothetical protein